MIRTISATEAENDTTPCRFCGRPFKDHMDPPTQQISQDSCLGSKCNFKPVVENTSKLAAVWDAGYEAGMLAQSQKSRGKPRYKIFNPYRKR